MYCLFQINTIITLIFAMGLALNHIAALERPVRPSHSPYGFSPRSTKLGPYLLLQRQRAA